MRVIYLQPNVKLLVYGGLLGTNTGGLGLEFAGEK